MYKNYTNKNWRITTVDSTTHTEILLWHGMSELSNYFLLHCFKTFNQMCVDLRIDFSWLKIFRHVDGIWQVLHYPFWNFNYFYHFLKGMLWMTSFLLCTFQSCLLCIHCHTSKFLTFINLFEYPCLSKFQLSL